MHVYGGPSLCWNFTCIRDYHSHSPGEETEAHKVRDRIQICEQVGPTPGSVLSYHSLLPLCYKLICPHPHFQSLNPRAELPEEPPPADLRIQDSRLLRVTK